MSLFSCSSSCNSCKNCTKASKIDERCSLKIALVGNPNVGKSVIFNALSGFYVEISNYPGTTVDVSNAFTEFGEIIDTPGAYSLGDYTDDEKVTQKVIKSTDFVINIVSALTIERDLFLTQQLIDIGIPIIIVINQIDEAKKSGIQINYKNLEDELGVKIIPAIAIKKQGIAQLINSIKNNEATVSNSITPIIDNIIKDLSKCERHETLIAIETQNSIQQEKKETIYSQRKEKINTLIKKIILHTKAKESINDIVGNLLLNPIIGSIVAIIMLYLLFQLLGVFVAGNIVDFIFNKLDTIYIPWITNIIHKFLPSNLIGELLIGEFGILTMSVKIIFGVLLPLITAFYFFMAILEDSGYLPRLAVLADNVLNKIGLNGRAIIPILLGFGCGAMGTITTRILGSKKERTIATAILGVAIPCAAQQGIIIALLAAVGGLKIWLIYLFVIFGLMILTGTVLDKFIKCQSTDLLIDLPPMRMPLVKNTIEKTIFRVWNFLAEAIPLFIISSIIITVLNTTGFLEWLQKVFTPISVHLLHLPAEFSNIFVMGLIRRDFASVGLLGMAGIEGGHSILSNLQILVASIVVTLFVPCIAALIVIFKERGLKETIFLWLSTFIISITVGAILARTLGFLF